MTAGTQRLIYLPQWDASDGSYRRARMRYIETTVETSPVKFPLLMVYKPLKEFDMAVRHFQQNVAAQCWRSEPLGDRHITYAEFKDIR